MKRAHIHRLPKTKILNEVSEELNKSLNIVSPKVVLILPHLLSTKKI